MNNADEIVRALLEDCDDCSERTSDGECKSLYYCANRDAAALIKSQAAEIKRQREMLSDSFQGHLLAELARKDARIAELEGITFWAQNRQLQADLTRVTAERDAAVLDLSEGMVCDVCVHDGTKFGDEPCDSCLYGRSKFEWRGVQVGEGETE